MIGAAQIVYEKAKYITTSPITKYGLRMCEHLGFKEVAKQRINGETYPVYELELDKTKGIPAAYKSILQMKVKDD